MKQKSIPIIRIKDMDKHLPNDNFQENRNHRLHLMDFNKQPLKDFDLSASSWYEIVELFSFFGTTLIANPLVWPLLPHEEEWGEKFVPLRELHPVHLGECWTIFAYDKRNQNDKKGNYPIRTDGLVLPCRWRRGVDAGNGHDKRLPISLLRLADRVKEQISPLAEKQNYPYKAEEFYLHLANFPKASLDNLLEDICALVDSGLEKDPENNLGGDVVSAWGALSTGLFFAMQNMAPPDVWPFSSVAYDVKSKAVQPVGFLKGKLSIVADFNVNQFVVANTAQVKEAKILRKQLVQETIARIRDDKKLLKGMDKKTESDKIHYLEAEIDNLKAHLDGLRSIVPVEVKESKELLGIIDDIANGYVRRHRRKNVMYLLELVIVLLLGLCGWQTQWRREAVAKDHLNKAINLLESNFDEPQTDVAIRHLAKADILIEAQQLFVNLVCQNSWLVPVAKDETGIEEPMEDIGLIWKTGIELPENYPLEISLDLKNEQGIELVSHQKQKKDKEFWRVKTDLDYSVHGELSSDGLVFILEGLAKGQNQFVAIDILTGNQLWRRSIQGNAICGSFSRDSELFAYVNQSGHLHVVNTKTGINEYEPVEVGRDIQYVNFVKDDSKIYVKRKTGKKLVYKLHHNFSKIYDLGRNGYSDAVFDGNKHIIYRICNTENRLEKVDSFTMRVMDFIEFEGCGKDLRLSDDGNRLILSSFAVSEPTLNANISDDMLKKLSEGKDVDLDALIKQIKVNEDTNTYCLYLFDLRTCFQSREKQVVHVPFQPDSLEFMSGNSSCILAGENIKQNTILRWNFADNSLSTAFDSLTEQNVNNFALNEENIAVNNGSTIDILTLDGEIVTTIGRDANQYRYVFLTKNGFLIKTNKHYRQLAVYDAKTGRECWHLDGYTTVRENSRWGIPFAVFEENMEIAVAVTDTSIQRFELKTGLKIGEEKALDWVVSQMKYVHRIGGTALAVGGNDKLRGIDKKGYYALIDCQNMNVLQNHVYDNDEFITFFGDESNLFVLFDKHISNIQNFLLVQNNKEAFVYLCEWLEGYLPDSNPPKATGIWHWVINELSKKNAGERLMSFNDNTVFSTVVPKLIDKLSLDDTNKVYLIWPQDVYLTISNFWRFIINTARRELARQNPAYNDLRLKSAWPALSDYQKINLLKNSPICRYAVENKEFMIKEKIADYSSDEKFTNIRKQIHFILGRDEPVEKASVARSSVTENMQALQKETALNLDKLSEIIRPYLLEQLVAGKEDAYMIVFDILDKRDTVHDLDISQRTKWLTILEEISMFEPFLPNGHRQATDFLEKLAADLEGKSLNLPQYRNLFAYLQQYLIQLYLVDKQNDKAIKALEKLQKYGKDDFVLPLVFDLYDILIKAYDNHEHDIFRLFFEWMGKNNINNELRKAILESVYQNVMDINRRAGTTLESKKLKESLEELLKESGTMIMEMAPESKAASFGWKIGDLIFDVDGIAGLNREQLEVVLTYFRRYKKAETINIRLNRKGQFFSTKLDVAILINGLGISY